MATSRTYENVTFETANRFIRHFEEYRYTETVTPGPKAETAKIEESSERGDGGAICVIRKRRLPSFSGHRIYIARTGRI